MPHCVKRGVLRSHARLAIDVDGCNRPLLLLRGAGLRGCDARRCTKADHEHAGTSKRETCSDLLGWIDRRWSDRPAQFCAGTLYEAARASLKGSYVECPLAPNSSYDPCWV